MSYPATVVVVGPLPPPINGAAKVTARIISELEAGNPKLKVVDTSASGSGPTYHLQRVVRHYVACRELWAHKSETNRSLYIGGAGGHGLWYQAVLMLFARILGFRTVFHHHSFTYCKSKSLAMLALISLAPRDTLYVALCHEMKHLLLKHYPTRTVLVLSNSATLSNGSASRRIQSAAETESRPVVLGHLSNLSIDKGLAIVFESFREVLNEGVDARLIIAGPPKGGSEVRLLQLAEQEFGSNFEYLGRDSNVREFFSSIDLFLFPSTYRHEAEPLVILESAQVGVPTVAFDVGCVSNLVIDCGWLVNVGANYPQVVVKAARDLSMDGAMRRRLGSQTNTKFEALRAAAIETQGQLIAILTFEQPLPSSS
jgi:glycosyltransferase involved in cell wall biosynthesis